MKLSVIICLFICIYIPLCAESLDEAAYTLPNIIAKVPALKNDNTGRMPMIAIEAFKLDKDDKSWQDAKPFPPEAILELKKRGLTQWIPPREQYIPFALALQKEGAGVIMMEGQAFNGPPDQAPATMHILPKDYKKLDRPGQQPVFPCPLMLEGWVITQQKTRATFKKFKDAGVNIDAVWLDWEIEPDWRDAQWDEAKNCSRCRKQFSAGVLDDQQLYRQFIEQWRVQLFSAYVVAPILEYYPNISITNWEEIISTHENPTPSWSGYRTWLPKDLGMYTAANPVAYGNTIWKKYNWKKEWNWPLDEAHMDRVYTSVMLNQISVHERNAMQVSPWKQSIPWVDRYCADDQDPKIPIMSRTRYREVLRHCWLRGADGMQIFNPLWFPKDAVKLAIATEEIADAVQIYDEMLTYRKFLDRGVVMNTDTLTPPYEGAIWSGLKIGNEAIIRAFTQAKKPVKIKIKPFAEANEIEIKATPEGCWYHLQKDGKKVLIRD
jgi:hypothetical protein